MRASHRGRCQAADGNHSPRSARSRLWNKTNRQRQRHWFCVKTRLWLSLSSWDRRAVLGDGEGKCAPWEHFIYLVSGWGQSGGRTWREKTTLDLFFCGVQQIPAFTVRWEVVIYFCLSSLAPEPFFSARTCRPVLLCTLVPSGCCWTWRLCTTCLTVWWLNAREEGWKGRCVDSERLTQKPAANSVRNVSRKPGYFGEEQEKHTEEEVELLRSRTRRGRSFMWTR